MYQDKQKIKGLNNTYKDEKSLKVKKINKRDALKKNTFTFKGLFMRKKLSEER